MPIISTRQPRLHTISSWITSTPASISGIDLMTNTPATVITSNHQAPPDMASRSSDAQDRELHSDVQSPSPDRAPPATATAASASGAVVATTDAVPLVDVDVANHIVFVIDRSGSMDVSDATPSTSKLALSRNHNNRLGCVYEAILRFVATRKKASQLDLVSIVLFDDNAMVAVAGKPILEVSESMLDTLLGFYGPGGGTSYSRGLLKARVVLQEVSRREGARDKRPVVVFLSDGGNSCLGGDPVTIIRAMKGDDPRLVVNTVHFGKAGARDQQVLRDMAEAGDGVTSAGDGSAASSSRGTYRLVGNINLDELSDCFEQLASNLSSTSSDSTM